MEDITNDSLVLSALSLGSDKAFDALFVRYYPKILGFVMNFCADRQDAENIVQDLFMSLWIKRKRFAEIKNLDSYLFISARNASLRYIKQSLSHDRLDEMANEAAGDAESDTKVCYDELYGMVMCEISKMPEQRRRIFLMSREQGMSNADIAEKLGISKRTVETHISLALAHLRKVFPAIVILAQVQYVYDII